MKTPTNGRQVIAVTVKEAPKRSSDDSRALSTRKSMSGPRGFKPMPTIAEELDEEAFPAEYGSARPKNTSWKSAWRKLILISSN